MNGRGDQPNQHDILTGTLMNGMASGADGDTTCSNWMSSGEGSALVGHHDRTGGGQNPTSWNEAHGSRGCSLEDLRGRAATAASTASPWTGRAAGARSRCASGRTERARPTRLRCPDRRRRAGRLRRRGVAGAARARVALITRPAPPAKWLAESIPGSARKLLERVGALDVLDAAGFVPNEGNTVWWAGMPRREERFGEPERGFHAERAALETAFHGVAREAGARLVTDGPVGRDGR